VDQLLVIAVKKCTVAILGNKERGCTPDKTREMMLMIDMTQIEKNFDSS